VRSDVIAFLPGSFSAVILQTGWMRTGKTALSIRRMDIARHIVTIMQARLGRLQVKLGAFYRSIQAKYQSTYIYDVSQLMFALYSRSCICGGVGFIGTTADTSLFSRDTCTCFSRSRKPFSHHKQGSLAGPTFHFFLNQEQGDCMTLEGSSTVNGNSIQLAPCKSESMAQKWFVDNNRYIRSGVDSNKVSAINQKSDINSF